MSEEFSVSAHRSLGLNGLLIGDIIELLLPRPPGVFNIVSASHRVKCVFLTQISFGPFLSKCANILGQWFRATTFISQSVSRNCDFYVDTFRLLQQFQSLSYYCK